MGKYGKYGKNMEKYEHAWENKENRTPTWKKGFREQPSGVSPAIFGWGASDLGQLRHRCGLGTVLLQQLPPSDFRRSVTLSLGALLPKFSMNHCCTKASLNPKHIDENKPQIRAEIQDYFSIIFLHFAFRIILNFYPEKIKPRNQTLVGIAAFEAFFCTVLARVGLVKVPSYTSVLFTFIV